MATLIDTICKRLTDAIAFAEKQADRRKDDNFATSHGKLVSYRNGLQSALNIVDTAIKEIQSEPPYGEWITGNVELLESLPDNTLVLFQKIHSDQLSFMPAALIKHGNYFKTKEFSETGVEISDLVIGRRYQILRPIPTTPEHEKNQNRKRPC